MIYYGKEKLLVTGSFDSLIKVYNDQEELSITRILTGGKFYTEGHLDSQITCLDLSQMSWLLASGSENGMVTIWDFQNAKVNSVF